MKTRKPSRKPRADSPETWPIVWRVVAPCAGGYDHDLTFLETPDEAQARAHWRSLRKSKYAARLERVACGPLPKGALRALKELRAISPQNPGAKMRKVLGYWEGKR